MPALSLPRMEAFAQNLARGMGPRPAGIAAGYKHDKNGSRQRAGRADVVARVKELEESARGGGGRDLSAIIERLIALAEQGRELKSAAAILATKAALAEAARLKLLLPEPGREGAPGAGAPAAPTLPVLTTEQWVAAFGSRP